MRTLQEKYNAVLEGNFSKTQFRRDAAIELPQFVSNVNSFDDTVAILKNKGIVTEAKNQEPKYSTAKPEDTIAPDVLDTGIKFELDKKYGTLDVTPEQYAKCREIAIKNLSKDVLYYVKQDSIQLDEPGEKMEKAKLNEGFLDRFKKKPAQSSPAPAKVLSADEIQAMIDAEAKTGTIGDILDAAVVQQTIDLRNATPEQIKTLVSVAREADSGEDTITGDNSMSYIEKLPNFTNDANEATSKEDAWKKFQEDNNVTDKTIKVAREDFEKEWEAGNLEEVDEAIQNIENDDHTKRRIAGLVNDFLQRYRDIPEVGAYAAQVKNNLEDGDPSTLKRYKSIMDEKDLIADLEAVTGVNFNTAIEDAEYEAGWNADDLNDLEENQLEESQYSISDIQNKFPDKAFDIQQAALRAVGARDVQAAYSKNAGDFEKALYDAAHGNLEEDQDFTLTPDERGEQERKKFDSYYTGKERGKTDIGNKVHTAKSPNKLKEEREALKEMFKKIIVNLINE